MSATALPVPVDESADQQQTFPGWRQGDPLFTRYAANPILTRAQWPYPINSVFNAGATLLPDGATLLLCRVEERTGLSHLCAARSANGIDGWRVDSTPTLKAQPDEFPEEVWGIEDPRITYVPELEQYAVVCTSFSRGGPGVSLAMTKDFKTFQRYGVVMTPEDKDAALMPRRIGGNWALIHRPVTTLGAHMWISYSPDLRHWGSHKVMLASRRGGWWDANKIGLCSPPIETTKGWLVLYHGVRQTASGSIYRLGLALFDLNEPEICLQRGDSWMFGLRHPMSAKEMSATSSSPAGKPSGRTAIRFISIMVRPMNAWRWLPAASASCFPGLMRTRALAARAVCRPDT